MSSTTVAPANVGNRPPLRVAEELDEEIDRLLRDAEHRLRAPSAVEQREDHGDGVELSLERLSYQVPTRALPVSLPQLQPGKLPQPYVRSTGAIARVDSSRLISSEDRRLAEKPRKIEDAIHVTRTLKKEKSTAGEDWFDMPRTDLTPEFKRDLQLLRMRSVLDPKRHYKKDGSSKKFVAPEFSQTGTVIQGPTEFFSSRIPNRDRKKTFVQEVLGKADAMNRFKSKYNDVQAAKTSGKKEFYKNLKAKRSKGKKYG